jgi:hypothetical protein
MAGSYFIVGETENGGGIDPNTEVNTGLSRRYNTWDDEEDY